ncbi:hypothetical protein TWF703_010496 [Orbilia oligospora]|uniref:Uncharacterized protein n=1 Tax=Orbilia oligospora TaxID=2813651 RepID=A0A7C8JII4_ORBOL|nr:hypothetical protein TWF703_010496 [Orbilia oligospora]
MTQKCMDDYSTVDLIIDNQKTIFNPKKYSYEPPRQVDDIHVQSVHQGQDSRLRQTYGTTQTIKIPSWLYQKHEIIPDLIRELQFCYTIMPCHGTLEDHVNLFLKAIWGPSTIVPGLEMKLMKLVLHRDMVIRNERRKWRGENRDAVMWSICEDGGTSYVSDQAAKLLNPNKRVESRKRDADEVLYRLGWEKTPGNWGSVRYKAHEPLHTQVLRLMSEQHGEKGGKGATNRNKGELVRKEKEKENTEVVKRVQTVFEVKLLHGADKVEDGEEESKAKKEGKGKSVTRRIGVGILRFMKIKK